MFQKFHSPALGGFAVVSHWLPFMAFAVPVGALGERVDPRRLIQCGMGLFILASLGWSAFFVTDTLRMWHAMVLLVIHGCAGVLWQIASQLLLHDIVPASELPSAVRLNATARTLGVLVGPAVGGALLLGLGPTLGIALNTLFYLPAVIWLWRAPYGPRFRAGAGVGIAAAAASAANGGAGAGAPSPPRRAVRGLADIGQAIRDNAERPAIVAMTLLAGAASFLVGNSYQAQMPAFAQDLGHGDPGTAYGVLLAADAAGALFAGVLLESVGRLRPDPRTALVLAGIWCAALAGFAASRQYAPAVALLFVAGFFELAFSSMAQTIVQLDASATIRGRVIGLFNMSSLGLRTFSGLTVGIAGTWVGVHASLAGAAIAMGLVVAWLLHRGAARAARTD